GRARARAVVVATDPPAAAALVPRLRVPPMNALTTLYHLAPEPPTSACALHLDGDRRGPVVNTSMISNVAPSYAPLRTLVSSSVVGAHDDAASERAVRGHLTRIYGTDTSRWEHVRTYALPSALPAMPPPLDVRQPVRLGAGLYVAGDHRDTASIQGAMSPDAVPPRPSYATWAARPAPNGW
ncbi:MAG: FAD-dependent oxidoreductase, partial [Actinomycetota bacterium]|nr:FAD-dependent oxidoreductase [Actinomycetota bacterium]